MNARESIENLWDRATPVAPLLDAYRAQVAAATRREDAAFLLNEERPKHASRAIFCDGITHVAHLLTERANNSSEAAS